MSSAALQNSTSGYPREILPGSLSAHRPFDTNGILQINKFAWKNTPVRSGQTFLTSQGSRLVLVASPSRVIYVLLMSDVGFGNKVFIQHPTAFINDVVFYPYEKAATKLQTVKKLAEYEVQIIIGILSTTSWSAFSLVVAGDLAPFLVKNKSKIKQWPIIFRACLRTNADFAIYAPTLRDKVLHSTLLFALEGSEFAISNTGKVVGGLSQAAVDDPVIAGRGMGIIAGKLTSEVFNGRITVLSAVWTLLSTLATKAMSTIPGAASNGIDAAKKLSEKDRVAAAGELISLIKRAGVSLTEQEASKIIIEVETYPKQLHQSLSQLHDAFKDYN